MSTHTNRRSTRKWSLILCWYAILLHGCTASGIPQQAPFSTVDARILLIDARAFPSTWNADPCGVGCDRTERPDHALRMFGRDSIAGHVHQEVFAFPSTIEAQQYFAHLDAALFMPLTSPDITFVAPSNFTYHSALADEYKVGCGKQVVPACRALLRYRNYVVEWYFDIDAGAGDGLQIQDIIPILLEMDAHVARTFHLTLPTAVP